MFLPVQYNWDKVIDLDNSAMSGIFDTSLTDSNLISDEFLDLNSL